MSFIAPVLNFMGASVAAKGQAEAGLAEQAAYNANAAALRVKAQTDLDAAEAEAKMQATANERRYGTIRTNYGASGVDVNTGSPLEVMADQHMQGRLAEELQRYQGKVSALQSRQAADIQVMQGAAAAKAGKTKAAATLLTGASQSISMFESSAKSAATAGAG